MAALTNPTVVAQGGGSGQTRWALLAFQKVTTGDTFDASTLAVPFVVVTACCFLSTSNRTATATIGTAATTVATMLGTGVAADAGLLLVIGE